MDRGRVVLGTGLGAVAGAILAPVVMDYLGQRVAPELVKALSQFSFTNLTTAKLITQAKVFSKFQYKVGNELILRATFGFEDRLNLEVAGVTPDNDFCDMFVKIDVNVVTGVFWCAITQLGSDEIEVSQKGNVVGTISNRVAGILSGGTI